MPGRRGNGEGTIGRRKDGRWCARATIGKREDGRPRVVGFYGRTRKEVAEKLNAALRERTLGTFVAPDKQTVADYMRGWLEHASANRLRPGTSYTYQAPVHKHIIPALGDVRLQELSAQNVQVFVDDLYAKGLAAGTVTRIFTILHGALRQAYKWGMVYRNVADQVQLRRGKVDRMQALTPGQARQLLRAVRGDRMEAYYTVAVTLGLRRGEALGLRWEDVDLGRGKLHIRRSLQRQSGALVFADVKTTASERTISLPTELVEALRRHLYAQNREAASLGARWHDYGLVFPSSIGTPYEPRNLTRDFNKLLDRAELPHLRVHDLRHSAASLMFAQGIPLEVISEILGHADKRTTANIYLHIFEKDHLDAAGRMDGFLRGRFAEDDKKEEDDRTSG